MEPSTLYGSSASLLLICTKESAERNRLGFLKDGLGFPTFLGPLCCGRFLKVLVEGGFGFWGLGVAIGVGGGGVRVFQDI